MHVMMILRRVTIESVKTFYSEHLRQSITTSRIFGTSLTGYSTIYALSSGQGKCGVAVVRISGSRSLEAMQKMTKICQPEPRRAYLRSIRDPDNGEVIDKGLCLWFPGPNSFTGEDSVEFQVHGGPAVLSALLTALSKLKFRHALPGEFTKRAFFNNKLDLVEIEGLADLIHAETEQQRKQALLQADGNLSTLYNKWKDILSRCVAHLEAFIDFSEEENIEGDVLEKCNNQLNNLMRQIKNHLADGRKGEILRNGVRTVIIGEPNVGKSSLLNYLVQRNAAIVSPIAGTTRDIVELSTDISGYPIILADTAGIIKKSKDIIEKEGVRRAKAYAEKADFIILMINALAYLESKKTYEEYLNTYINKLELEDILLDSGRLQKHCLVIMNKTDLLNEETNERLRKSGIIGISCVQEEGFDKFLESATNYFKEICGNPSREHPTISQTRHRNHLTNCLEHLCRYFTIIARENYDIVIATQEIRNAMRELGKVTGHVSTEQILDIIFKEFCIGK
ncbi:tRNA modification GTPase GTPBP3, mitochondrial [Orussus abietinus]|uniref:tRNA modification GTPase GTPBP3, mitochondrial n=1 Tax=Orussus abietinus TaxID=222816 RepID=UPI000626E732|nr:tRNA modification GTPase GTPBP3, mitochondrial [Orussus abietinus]